MFAAFTTVVELIYMEPRLVQSAYSSTASNDVVHHRKTKTKTHTQKHKLTNTQKHLAMGHDRPVRGGDTRRFQGVQNGRQSTVTDGVHFYTKTAISRLRHLRRDIVRNIPTPCAKYGAVRTEVYCTVLETHALYYYCRSTEYQSSIDSAVYEDLLLENVLRETPAVAVDTAHNAYRYLVAVCGCSAQTRRI